MHVAIIGLGEVGRCYAAPLQAAGHELSLVETRPSAAARDMAARWGRPIHDRPNGQLASAEWVLSCVTGAQALAVVESVLPYLAEGSSIADLTTAPPDIKRRAAQEAHGRAVRYVDTAIMGAISLGHEHTPLLASGEGSDQLKSLLEPVGGRVRVIAGGAPGDAISLKILRSVFTKGMEALAVELLTSAEKQNVRPQLYEQLRDIDETPLRSFLDMLVRTHVVHARRRLHEVHDAERELAAQGLPSLVLTGVAERFLATADALEQRPLTTAEPTVETALEWLLASPTSARMS